MLGVLAHWTIYWNEWVIEWIELKWMIPPLKTGCPPRLELGSSLAVAQMAGQGSRKEDTQNEEESDFDTTQTLTHWVRGGGSDSRVSVSIILCSVALFLSRRQSLGNRCRSDSCCLPPQAHTTCQLRWSYNMIFNEANWETSQHAMVCMCMCVLVCVVNILC